MNVVYAIVSVDLQTGLRTELPWLFDTQVEAAMKIRELGEPEDRSAFIITTHALEVVVC